MTARRARTTRADRSKRSDRPNRSSRTKRASRPARPSGQARRARSGRPRAARVVARPYGDGYEAARRDVVRYAVIGLGYFAQAAVLPAFKRAERSELVALVSDDATKLRELGDKYDVQHRFSYDGYDELLGSGLVDAVYICLPNDMHADFTLRAAAHGVHVLCEKPLAVTTEECRRMVDACRRARVRLMTAYRLHFNDANLQAVQAIQDGDIGDPRFIVSSFASQVKPSGIRVRSPTRGGGPLYDIGIYCINAARYLFRDEPVWVQAAMPTGQKQARFSRIEEQVTCILGFPEGRTATFTASYGAADVACYEVYGTKGCLCLDNAYEFTTPMRLEVEGDSTYTRRFLKRDQVAPELSHFSSCILDGSEPEPSGKEGLIDVAIIEAIQRSAESGRRVPVRTQERRRRPTREQAHRVRPHRMPRLVNAKHPFQD